MITSRDVNNSGVCTCFDATQFNLFYQRNIVMIKTKKTCCICKKENASYKCPTCEERYCSIACSKKHKAQVCKPRKMLEKSADLERFQEPVSNTRQKYLFPTIDTVPIEKLEQLHNSNELKQCLTNPHVRTIIKEVVNSDDPTSAIAKAMREPIFVEVADACLKIVQLPEEDRPC